MPSVAWITLVACALFAVSLVTYQGALDGEFLADDYYLTSNPWVALPGPEPLSSYFDPSGDLRSFGGGNYMPLTFLSHAIQWKLWKADTFNYHVTNVLLHSLNSALLIALLCTSGIPKRAALVAGMLFALHPANVEAVAWISQLRTLLSMGFALVALLLFRRHPFWSAVPFMASLLYKAAGAFALPMLAALCWARYPRGDFAARHGWAFGLWTLLFAAFTWVQMTHFAQIAGGHVEPYADWQTLVRTSSSIGVRYLAMAATGTGTSAFHELPRVRDYLDPWWLAGVALAPMFLWRIVWALRRRREEAAWWIGAAAGFVPISQIVPFLYPFADRYLYFILPGLLGGVLLAGHALSRRPGFGRAGFAVFGVLIAVFGFAASRRAHLWVDDPTLRWEAATHYPEGALAPGMQALAALDRGQKERALELVRISVERGGDFKFAMGANRRFSALWGDPRFREMLFPGVRRDLEILRARNPKTQLVLRDMAASHLILGEYDEAIQALERGLRLGGRYQPKLVDMLAIAEHRQRVASEGASSDRAAPSEPPQTVP